MTQTERAAYARGLRAAARQARREATWHEKHRADENVAPLWRSTCWERAYISREIGIWCDRRAAAVERGER
jgi:hypothetical protein